MSRSVRTSLCLIAVIVLASVVGAQDREIVLTPIAAGSTVEWQTLVEHGGATLTISRPDGGVVREEFAAGETPIFAGAKKGETLPDGNYRWELVVAPRTTRTRVDGTASEGIRSNESRNRIVSGTFSVENGAIRIPRELPEGRPRASAEVVATPEDQVIADDLIVQGSTCIGLDCVNNESFGFDTIRLKENNTRIKFDDTSSGVGFPANDWQLTANDSASGGASKFSIEDITGAKVPFTVTAGAATNSIFVDSAGRVGFRTSTPVLDLHVATSNTPALRFEQNSSGGFTAQTWDVAGNEANFFVRDVTGGSRLPFRIRPGAPTSSIDISAEGKVGIGTASPSNKLHVLNTADSPTVVQVENKNTGTSARATFRGDSDVALFSLAAHGSARTETRYGKSLGGWTELTAFSGTGIMVGTNGASSLILGTNNANRLEIGANGGVTVNGNFTATGTKNFAMVDPDDSTKAIYFAALEGPEAGTYFRGTARTVHGEAVIELPHYFSEITETANITVQLTPVGSWGQLFVAEKTPSRLVVRTSPGSPEVSFDFLVQGIRRGYLGYEVVRENNLPR
jgi:hypothetical protein